MANGESNGARADHERFVPGKEHAATLLKRFLNRYDTLCFDAEWKKPCPVRADADKLDLALQGHVHGKKAPGVTLGTWTTLEGKECIPHQHCRLGTYFPGIDNKVICAAIDSDGGPSHAAPLANPLLVARTIQRTLAALGMPNYLERSRSLNGWHNWLFFAERVDAALVRRVLLTVLGGVDCELTGGEIVAVGQEHGPEIFPKADTLGTGANAVGSQVWLPFYHDSKPGGGLFYFIGEGEKLIPFLPEEFETIPLATLQALDPWQADTDSDSEEGGADAAVFADFNRNGWAWAKLLPGWKEVTSGRWRRPGKTDGISATTGFCRAQDGTERFYSFSPSTQFTERKCYSKSAVYRLQHHGNDRTAAAAALRKQNFGGKTDSTSSAEPWGQILSLDAEPPTDPFPLDALPLPQQEYIRQVSYCMNVPRDHVALSMLTVGGAAIGNARRLRINRSHEQHGGLYSVVIDRPGSKKTPMLKLVAAPLYYHQELWRKDWEPKAQAWEAQVKGKKDKGGLPPKPILRRIVSTNATVESLLLLLKENPRGMLLLKDELSGLVASHGQYKGGKGDDKQIYLELWSGNSVDLDRKSDRTGDSLHVSNAFLAILGGLQPAVINSLAGQQTKGQQAPDDGTIDRWLPSFPQSLPAVGDDGRDVDQCVLDAWQSACSVLLKLGMEGDLSDPASWDGPRHVCMTPEAKLIWQDFTEQIATETNEAEEAIFGNFGIPGVPVGVWSKLTGYAGRLTLIVHYLRYAAGVAPDGHAGEQIIDATDVTAAVRIACWLKSHLRKLHRMVSSDDRLDRARVLISIFKRLFLSQKSSFKRWEIHRHCQGKLFPTADALDGPLEILVQRNYLRRIEQVRKTLGGRAPEPIWEINPSFS